MKKSFKLHPLAPRPNLDFSKGVRGKHIARIEQGTNVALIAPDLLDTFPDAESVNNALSSLKAWQSEARITKKLLDPTTDPMLSLDENKRHGPTPAPLLHSSRKAAHKSKPGHHPGLDLVQT